MYFPVLGKEQKAGFQLMDLSGLEIPEGSTQMQMNHILGDYVEDFRVKSGGIPYGGFLEKRSLYQSSGHFGSEKRRNIHLGTDLWVPPFTPIYAAKDGVVHSVGYNSAILDYGWCVIIAYEKDEFVLYGHMAGELLKEYHPEMEVKQGEVIGYTGDYGENGGWYPHLHLQVMNSMLHYRGDFPGVSTADDVAYYKSIIKDPMYLL